MGTEELRAIEAVWDATPDYGSENCQCGSYATPAPNCPVHWAMFVLERHGFDYQQTKEAIRATQV